MKSILLLLSIFAFLHSGAKDAIFNLSFAHASVGKDESITFDGFVRKVGIAFTDELLDDLRKKLPEDFLIWGYDVGDFSGDGKYDIVMSIKPKHYKGKKLQVHFFINRGDSVLDVKTMDVSYHDIPLEVGFTIERGVCFMTTKLAEYNWLIRGYTFSNGSFILVDRYEATRLFQSAEKRLQVGYETYFNYRNLLSNENFFNPVNNSSYAKIDYYTFPAYRKGRGIFKDYAAVVADTTDRFILAGKEHWKGSADLSFASRAYYDSTMMCFSIDVVDDSIVTTNPAYVDENDYVQLWFDCGVGHKVEVAGDSAVSFRNKPDSSLYTLTISLGNFSTEKPKVKFVTRFRLSEIQLRALTQMEVSVERTGNGYSLDIQIPYRVFGYTSGASGAMIPQFHKRDRLGLISYPIGFTAVVHDADDAKNPNDETVMATSKLEQWNPLTFGVLRFIPDGEYYGEVVNLFLPSILRRIREVGL